MNREKRTERDREIVAARLRGLSVAAAARGWQVSERTVGRAMKAWRDEQRPLRDPREIERAIHRTVAAVRQLDERLESCDDPLARARLILERTPLLATYVRLLQESGIPLRSAFREYVPLPDLIPEINAGVRRALADYGVSQDTIETAIDAVMATYDRYSPGAAAEAS